MQLCNRIKRFFELHTKLVLFCVSILLLAWNIFWYKIPWSGDSTFTIASGMYFAGYDWSSFVSHNAYFGFSYSIWLVPLIKLISNPIILYRCMVLCTVVVYTLVILLIYSILNKYFNLEKVSAAIAAIACVIWVPTLQQKDFVTNEVPLLFWVVLVFYLLLKLAGLTGTKKYLYSALFGGVLAYGYNIHSRSIVFFIAVIMTIAIYGIWEKKMLVSLRTFVPIFGIGLIIARQAATYVQDALWSDTTSTQLANTMSTTIGKVRFLEYLTDIDQSLEFLKIFSTNLLTYVFCTGGLFAFAFFVFVPVLKKIYKERKEKKMENSYWLIAVLLGFISFLGMIAAVSLSFVGILESGEYHYRYLFYVRYAAPFGSIIWIIFFAYLFKYGLGKVCYILGLGGIFAEYICLNYFVNERMSGLLFNYKKTMIFNIFKPALDWLQVGEFDDRVFLLCMKVMLFLGSIFFILMLKNKKRTLCICFIVLSYLYYLNHNSVNALHINDDYISIDATMEYFQHESELDWREYNIYFGGSGSYLSAVRYGLFDIDMKYVKTIDDEFDLSDAIYITNDITVFEEANMHVIELDEKEYIVTQSREIYMSLLGDSGNKEN